MSEPPLFSIVVPTMNMASTVRACLYSIADQSCPDVELIVVDGGSSDATVDVAATYADRLGG